MSQLFLATLVFLMILTTGCSNDEPASKKAEDSLVLEKEDEINGFSKMVIDKPVIDKPVIDEPVIDEPVIDEVVIVKPVIDEISVSWYRDVDKDSYGDRHVLVSVARKPDGYVTDNSDCDDGSKSINPAQIEILNGIDDNCNGVTDEGAASWYRDVDGDGYGDASKDSMASMIAIGKPDGYVMENTDCDDSSASINPSVPEIANDHIDNNCDNLLDERYDKLDAAGNHLSQNAHEWSCVKDNDKGLVWEVKKADAGLHDKNWTYSWFDSTHDHNPGSVDEGNNCLIDSRCDTEKYTQDVNEVGLCGYSDWRMPSKDELRQLVKSKSDKALEKYYFPNTMNDWYWSGSTDDNNENQAWFVILSSGYNNTYGKDRNFYVRLVRKNN